MIYTFYSFKGGVGRSMALANIAECFHLKGLRVVMLDWDLEAPGLESFFFERRKQSPSEPLQGVDLVQSRLGLIDLLTEYRRSFSALAPAVTAPVEGWAPRSFQARIARELNTALEQTPSYAQLLDEHLSLSTYLVPIHEPDGEGGGLWMLPAGWRHKERFEAYAEAVQAFDWEDFYVSFRGKEFFDWMRAKLLEVADVVLIDSRTGVTEMGGVCARQLADVVVSFCAPNSQNVDGVARMVKSFKRAETIKARDNRPLDTIVIPTRVDPQEVQKLEEFLARFEEVVNESEDSPELFREVGSRYWDLRIPYRTVYSYEERRVIGRGIKDLDPTRGLETAYHRIASHLALLAPDGGSIRQRFKADLQRQFPALLPKVGLMYESGFEARAHTIRQFIEDSGIGVWPDAPGEEASASSTVVTQSVHVVVVTGVRPALEPMRQQMQLARQLGRWIHIVGPSRDWVLPAWLQGARTYGAEGKELLERLQIAKAGVRAPMMAPPITRMYVERPELQQRLKVLLLEGAASRTRGCYALWGEGGSGKSALASAVAADPDVIDGFPDGILWVNASEPNAIEQLLVALTGEPATDGAAAKVIELLRGRRVLLVIDEAWTISDVTTLMEIGDRATRLVLTRNLDVASSLGEQVVTVGAMTPHEAAQLLTGSQAGEVLAEQLGNWPLALALARSRLEQQRAKQRTLPDAIEELEEKFRRHGVVAFDGIAPEAASSVARNHSVAASVDATVLKLAGWQRRRLQQLVQTIGSTAGTFDAVSTAWDRSGTESGEPYPFDRRERDRLLQQLSALGLIEWDAKSQSVTLLTTYRRVLEAQGVIGQTSAPLRKPRISSANDRKTNTDVDQVKRILGGQEMSFPDAMELCARLKGARYFGYARQLLSRMRRMPGATRPLYLAQQLALCTYKDTDLGADQRSRQALAILDEADPLRETTNQETLGLAGAVYKYRYRAGGQISHLERSAAYYLRGYAQGVDKDWGYTGINAAFVLDLLAHQEEVELHRAGSGTVPLSASGEEFATAAQRRALARRIRAEIVETLPRLAKAPGNEWAEKQWWFLVTVAEAFFGLKRQEEARFWLREALAVDIVEWEYESTARQLAELAWSLNGGAEPEPGSPESITLHSFLGNDAVTVDNVTTGKVGLALSGGGFRASLFHIGVLARLAETDVLRHVDAVSCVSGGSIIGAHYYLELRKLLQSKRDQDITREDYIALVKRIERDFTAGVQSNLRTRLYANPWVSLKCLVLRRYNRTDRLGELFESELFSRVEKKKKWWLNELTIQPLDAPEGFSPKLDNWRRSHKVPVLILNATTLNTGHNWQFTATWMGEPPAGAGAEVDTNDLLRRMYYWEAPPSYRKIRLGRAVAASACVPGLFEAVELDRLFPARSVRLVDGGVHDNQGIAALLDQDCSVLVISDASGQMASLSNPSAARFQALRRSSAITMARVREIEFRDLDARFKSSQLKGLQYLHLKKGLEVDPIDWIGCVDPFEVSADAKPIETRGPLTSYGIPKETQERISGLRTDLDSFTDAEAQALMYSGYRMASSHVQAALPSLDIPSAPVQGDWGFLAIEKTATKAKDFEAAHDDLNRMLTAGRSNGWKVWRLGGLHWILTALLVTMLVVTVVVNEGAVQFFSLLFGAVETVVLFLGALLTVSLVIWYVIVSGVLRLGGWQRPFARLGPNVTMATVGWIPWALHQHLIDPLFLLRGGDRSRPLSAKARQIWKPLVVSVVVVLLSIMPFVTRGQERATIRTEATRASGSRDWQQAVVAWDKLIERDSRDTEARIGRARANRELGQYPQAIADFTEAIRLGRPEALPERAETYRRAGDAALALADEQEWQKIRAGTLK